ncbi:hypothetical protein BN59_01668 [Legionella massiliensis]|uniref:Uncharacterized protein n=1 Tax=Legionella massiliensis TaxID=1034943 RepID=A0A078KSF7_9GAMM|nr:hypothetical protein [Legionella massiliensis]CDZ77385.1 hypothetical protein BN59_01668 [Legionella massiliensis]CEE13123.1 hypothetical protein BN1094_01668 [Legionella massiliensis]
MYLSKLGFFKEQENLKNNNKISELNHIAANLKNSTLRRMLCAYLQQELNSLNKDKKSKLAIEKQKRLIARLKFTRGKRQAKKRLILRNNHKVELIEVKKKRAKPAVRYSMR